MTAGVAQKGPVLIVGAGPTGMTAAMELTRMGVPVRLVDKLTAFSDTSRALAVQARTVELMLQRGPGAAMLRLGNVGRRAVLHGDRAELGEVSFDAIDSRFPFILLLAQSETERLLREQIGQQGVEVERATELVAVAQHGDGVTAVLRHAEGALETVEAAYLIDACGAHSVTRRTLGLQFEGKSLPHTYALADLHLEGSLPENVLSIFLSRHGLLAAFPLGSRRFRLIVTEFGTATGEGEPSLEEMQAAYDQAAYVPAQLHGMIWSSRFHINSRMVDRLRVGRVFLGGDAAHIHSPAGGQGMNTGIQDMVNLSWKLAMVYHGVAADRLLDTYAEERLPVIRRIVQTTERATDAANSGSSLTHGLVEHLVPLLLGSEVVRHAGANQISQIAVNYRESPLNGPEQGRGAVRAGDRVPDVRVRLQAEPGSKAAERWLQELLDPSRLTLLLFADAQAPLELATSALAAGWLTWQRVDGDALTERFGESRWALVRPDGYLLMCGKGEEAGALTAWAERWLTPRR